MRNPTLALLAAVLCLGAATTTVEAQLRLGASDPQGTLRAGTSACARIPGCVLVWADEFDGDAVDESKWSFMLGDGSVVGLPPGWGNNELQYYRAENATIADGMLTIAAKEESFEGYDYTSARLRSLGKGDWLYGRMEMRARMPIGQGLWPAFWMLPSDNIYGGWAASGEIDVVEYIGSQPNRILGTIHFGGSWPRNRFITRNYFLPTGTWNDDFHTFAIEWDLTEIRWYVDGLQYAAQSRWFSTGGPFPAPFNADFHLLLNLAVGGNLPGPPDATTRFPQTYEIDYVRVYQAPPRIEIVRPTPGDVIAPGGDVTISAEVDPGVVVRSVEFLQGKAVLGRLTEAPFEWTVPNVSQGCYVLRARLEDDNGRWEASAPVELQVGDACSQAPYRMTPVELPAQLEAEEFDLGGPGVAYEDANPDNIGSVWRPLDGVDLERTSDTGSGYNVGWMSPGEWIEYAVDAPARYWDVSVRVASADAGGTLHLEFDGRDVSGPVDFGSTGGWQRWESIDAGLVRVEPGVSTMRIAVDEGGFNVNHVTFAEPPDADGDGIPDEIDECPASIVDATVVIDACDSGTPNLVDEDGCTFSDAIAEAAADAKNHGRFVRQVSRLATERMKDGRIDGAQRGSVVSCAARSDLP